MSKTPAFLFYFNDWLASTSSMQSHERGYYIQLLSQQASLGGLPNDVEELAFLAGVRFSELEAFKQAFKRTLIAKFEKNEQGMLVNKKLVDVMTKRNNYSVKQAIRGKIGALVKKSIKEFELNKIEQTELRQLIKENKIYEKEVEKLEDAFKYTLKAFIINRDRNRIINNIEKEKGGVGEKEVKTQCIASHVEAQSEFLPQSGEGAEEGGGGVVLPFSTTFPQTWQQWKTYLRAEFKTGYNSIQSEQASLKSLTSLANGIEEKATKIIEQSMANRWKTFYELKNKNQNEKSNTGIYSGDFLSKHIKS